MLVPLYYRGIILCIFSGLILVHLYYRGIILCIFSGLMYGQMFTGATYIQNHRDQYLPRPVVIEV